MTDAASFDAIMQCNLLEVFCEALGAALFVTDKRDEVSFASVRLQHLFPIPDEAIQPGKRARDLYSALFDAGCRLGIADIQKPSINREDWIAERVAIAWRERVDTIEQCGPGRWLRMVSRRFPSGLGLTIFLDVSEHKKKENLWRLEQERVRLTEEVLDALPVAVAVKDQHLNFAAVNQRFCAMLDTTPEEVIGRGLWDLFEEALANSLGDANRKLLATGEERRSLISVVHPDGTTKTLLHRATRIGRPGYPYLAMTFEDIASASQQGPYLSLRFGKQGTADAEQPTVRRIVHICPDGNLPAGQTKDASTENDICVIRTEAELLAFLPAVREAGLTIDLIVIAPDAPPAFAAIAEAHGIEHRTDRASAQTATAPVAERTLASAGVRSSAETTIPGTRPGKIDILVVEDNLVNQLVAEQIFGSLGLEFAMAANGQDGLARIAELKPALIFADVTLPDMPFGEFADSIPALYAQTGIQPAIIAVLPKSTSAEHRQCQTAEIADCLSKPLSPEAVDLMIRKHIFEFRNLTATSPKTAA